MKRVERNAISIKKYYTKLVHTFIKLTMFGAIEGGIAVGAFPSVAVKERYKNKTEY